MLPILTPVETAAVDEQSSMRGLGVEALMENAGRAVARAASRLTGGTYGRRAVIACGKGNNGGDGLVAARLLHARGAGVTAVLMGEPEALTGPTGANFRRYVNAGGVWRRFSRDLLAKELRRADVIVDAMFGTGFRGEPQGDFGEAIALVNGADAPVVSVDIPSGVEGETGAVRGSAIEADVTVTFGALKPGLVLYPGAAHAGDIEIDDIGIPGDLLRSELSLVEPGDLCSLLPLRDETAHKRSSGVLLVVAGSRSMTGAAILSVRSAYRAGAGLVTLAAPASVIRVAQGALVEPTFLPLPETESGAASIEGWEAVSQRFEDVDALAAGPGSGRDPSTVELIGRIVKESPVPIVLDADGLNAFEGRGADLADRSSPAVMTPHAGEFARLTDSSAREISEDRIGRARRAAGEWDCTVLLKGARTIIAGPDGRAFVNPTGGANLATAGTGDVLTGVVGAFLARGLAASDAAVVGSYVHGAAGDLAAADMAEGTTATDVSETLPIAISDLRRAWG